MANHIIKFIYGVIITGLFGSCHCSDTTCPSLDEKSKQWLPNIVGDSVPFKNDNGDEIVFVFNQSNVTAESVDCGPDGLGGCKCPECPTPSCSLSAITNDSTRKIVNTLGITINYYRSLDYSISKPLTNSDTVKLSYYIFDHRNSIIISPSLKINSKDSLLTSFTAGTILYTNVILHESDTISMAVANPIYNVFFILKTYYSKEYGVVAFYDSKTHSLFYRKP